MPLAVWIEQNRLRPRQAHNTRKTLDIPNINDKKTYSKANKLSRFSFISEPPVRHPDDLH